MAFVELQAVLQLFHIIKAQHFLLLLNQKQTQLPLVYGRLVRVVHAVQQHCEGLVQRRLLLHGRAVLLQVPLDLLKCNQNTAEDTLQLNLLERGQQQLNQNLGERRGLAQLLNYMQHYNRILIT